MMRSATREVSDKCPTYIAQRLVPNAVHSVVWFHRIPKVGNILRFKLLTRQMSLDMPPAELQVPLDKHTSEWSWPIKTVKKYNFSYLLTCSTIGIINTKLFYNSKRKSHVKFPKNDFLTIKSSVLFSRLNAFHFRSCSVSFSYQSQILKRKLKMKWETNLLHFQMRTGINIWIRDPNGQHSWPKMKSTDKHLRWHNSGCGSCQNLLRLQVCYLNRF